MATRTNERTARFTTTFAANTAMPLGITLHATENIIGVKNASTNAAAIYFNATKKDTRHVYFSDSAKGNAYEIYSSTCTATAVKVAIIPYPTSVVYPTKTLDCPNLKGKALYWYVTYIGNSNSNTNYLNKDFIVVTSESSYTLSSAVSPASTGTVTLGATTVYQGDSISISASPASGYKFSSWSVSGGTVASSSSASTTVTIGAGNCTVTANFAKQSYTLTTAVSPSGYGTVTAGSSMEYQATKSLTATAGTGRYFSSWSKTAGTLSSTTTNPTTFTMGASAATVTANFGTSSYTLTTGVSPSGAGSVTAGGSLAYQGTKSLTATAATGYTFSSWSKTSGSLSTTTAATTTFTMGAANATVTANFTANNYTLTVAKGTGIASVSGGGSKAYKSSNAISATLSTGYNFSTWTSNNGGTFASATSASTNFTMPAGNVTVTATGTPKTYTLTVAKGTGIASVTGGGTKGYATVNAISATVSTGYTFKNWTSSNGGTFANANSASTNFTMPNNAVTVTANATINSYTLTTAVSPTGKGCTVTAGGSMNYNATKSLTATPGTGYSFSSWSKTAGTLSSTTTNPTTFTMGTSAATVTANFTINSYVLTVAKGTGIASVTGGGTVNYASSNNISATVSDGYTFNTWTSNNGGTFGNASAASTTFTMPAGAATVTASATINSYLLTTTVSPSGSGTVTAGETLNYGSTKSLTATPATGYSFDSWSKTAGTLSSTTANPTTFTMGTSAATVTANFTHVSYTLSSDVSPSGGGTVTLDANSGYYNDVINISATAETGYEFTGWTTTGGTLGDSTAASTTITMPAANTTVTATFALIDYAITITTDPVGAGTVTTSPSGTANYGDTVTLSQTPATGYAFDGYTTSPVVTITNNTFSMPASAVSITANYHVSASSGVLDKSSYEGGETAVLTINVASLDFTHRCRISFGNDKTTEWVSTAAGVTTANIYIPVSWVTSVDGNTSITGGILTLETYDGQTLLGTYEITGLTYTVLDSTIPDLIVWRCDANGNAYVSGEYAKYSFVKPSSISTYEIRTSSDSSSNPSATDDILPNNKKIFTINNNHNITLRLIYQNEIIDIVRDIPKITYLKKRFSYY